MAVLTTFSGARGDILWSLPTVRALAARHWEHLLDFGIMPQYEAMVPLLREQEYIDDAFVIPDWCCVGSPHGDQPWQAPIDSLRSYDYVYHLTYRCTPDIFLASYIAREAGVSLDQQPEPFISVSKPLGDEAIRLTNKYVAVGFNPLYANEKDQFMFCVSSAFPDIFFVDVTSSPWVHTAQLIKHARCFIGCRSSNHVLAHGLGQKMLIFEPHPHRAGQMPIFTSPWGSESQVKDAAEAVSILKGWLLD